MPSAESLQAYEARTLTYTGGEYQNEPFAYRLLKPATIEPGKRYPLVLFLHGAGERGSDNAAQLQYLPELMAKPEMRQKFPCFLIAPQCREGKLWADANWSDKESSVAKPPTDQMQVALLAVEETTQAQPVDLDRIYVTGLSMGGYGSWDLAIRTPEKFAAAVPICGGGDESQAARLVGVPIWAWHGDADPAVPVERSRRMIAAIRQAGGNPKYTELAGVGHDSWNPAYRDPHGPIPWLFEQSLAARTKKTP